MLPNRRDFLLAAAATASAGVIWSAQRPRAQAQEAPPETTTIRLAKSPSLCVMPQYVVDELLAAEGLTRGRLCRHQFRTAVERGDRRPGRSTSLCTSRARSFCCLIAAERSRCSPASMSDASNCSRRTASAAVADLKGRSVGISALESSPHVFVSAMAALVGLDPAKDINWVTSAEPKPIELFLDGKVDAFLGFPPEPQQLRAQGVNHVIVNSAQDRPWSQYFCCMLAGNPDFVRTKPIAAKARGSRDPAGDRSLPQRADRGCAANRGPRLHPEL